VPRIRLGTTDPGQTTPVFRPEAIGQNDSKTEIGPKSRLILSVMWAFAFQLRETLRGVITQLVRKFMKGGAQLENSSAF